MPDNNDELTWIGGLIPVQAAVDGGNRLISRILVQDDRLDGATARLQKSARERAIPLERVAETVILQHTDQTQYGGVIAEVGPRRFLPLAELLGLAVNPAIFMIDGVEDPYNLGQAIRSLYAAGATGLVLRPRDWMLNGDIVMRSSAGASELIPMATADSADSAAEFLRSQGLKILAADPADFVVMGDVDLVNSFFMVLGGEKRGLSKGFLRSADIRVSIPYGRPFDAALSTAAAASILGFEMSRQRRMSTGKG